MLSDMDKKNIESRKKARLVARKNDLKTARQVGADYALLRRKLRRSVKGCSREKLYGVWDSLLRRCYNESDPDFVGTLNYVTGKFETSRTVCERWHDYQSFKEDCQGFYSKPGAAMRLKSGSTEYNVQTVSFSGSGSRQRAYYQGEAVIALAWRHGIPYTTLMHRIAIGMEEPELFLSAKALRKLQADKQQQYADQIARKEQQRAEIWQARPPGA